MKKIMMAIAALTTLATPVAASAQGWGHGHHRGYGYDRGYDYRGYDYRGYDRRGYDYRNYDRRYRNNYRRCDNGTTGTIVGALAGGLLGRSVDRYGDRTPGTVLGGVGGALLGRELTRNCR